MLNFKTDHYRAHVTYSMVIDGWLGRWVVRRRKVLSREADVRWRKREARELARRNRRMRV